MKRVNAWMSTVWPTILNLSSLVAARSESDLAFLARSRSAALCVGDCLVSSDMALFTVSATAALRGALVCVISVSHVYCGSAFDISYIRMRPEVARIVDGLDDRYLLIE